MRLRRFIRIINLYFLKQSHFLSAIKRKKLKNIEQTLIANADEFMNFLIRPNRIKPLANSLLEKCISGIKKIAIWEIQQQDDR